MRVLDKPVLSKNQRRKRFFAVAARRSGIAVLTMGSIFAQSSSFVTRMLINKALKVFDLIESSDS